MEKKETEEWYGNDIEENAKGSNRKADLAWVGCGPISQMWDENGGEEEPYYDFPHIVTVLVMHIIL